MSVYPFLVQDCLDSYSFVRCFEIGNCESSNFILLFRRLFGLLGVLGISVGSSGQFLQEKKSLLGFF